MTTIPPNDLRTIITDPNGAETLVKWADTLGKDPKKAGLTTSQIRALFGEVRQIQAQWSMSQESRQKAPAGPAQAQDGLPRPQGGAVQALVDALRPALDEVISEKDAAKQDGHFHRFVEFFEAILAYHKAYGGN